MASRVHGLHGLPTSPMAGCRQKARVIGMARTSQSTGCCHLLRRLGRYASMAPGGLARIDGASIKSTEYLPTYHYTERVPALGTGIGCLMGLFQQLCPIGGTQLVCQDPPEAKQQSVELSPKGACMNSCTCMMQSQHPRQGSRMGKHNISANAGPIGATALTNEVERFGIPMPHPLPHTGQPAAMPCPSCSGYTAHAALATIDKVEGVTRRRERLLICRTGTSP